MSFPSRWGDVSCISKKPLIFLLCFLLSLASFLTAQDHPNINIEPFKTYVNQTIRVKAGEYIRYTFPLFQGTTLHAKFVVTGGSNNKANVWLLDLANFLLFQNGKEFRYYKGTSMAVSGVASYTFKIPETNTYVLIIDNRGAMVYSRTVSLYVYGISPQETTDTKQGAEEFQKLYDGLKQLFIFKDFQISFRHCGFENAFSDPNITICIELIEKLASKNLESAMGFVLFHELGHTLLHDWDLPLWDNEDVQDEFAVVVCLLAEARESAVAAAKYWSDSGSSDEALAKLYIDDRHTISPQRARNIIHWLDDPDELLRRWQKMLIPNMQTEALRALDQETDSWTNHDLIRSELKRR
jgi:hypothetical protein